MNELNPNPQVRPRQLLASIVVSALFLALLMAAAIAGGAAAKSGTLTGFESEDGRRTAPRIVEPSDSLRKVQRPVVQRDDAVVDLCTGEGLVASRGFHTAVEVQEMIDTYCYPQARLAGQPDDGPSQGVERVDVCTGEGLIASRGFHTAMEVQEMIDTYCYEQAYPAGVEDDEFVPFDGRFAGRVDE